MPAFFFFFRMLATPLNHPLNIHKHTWMNAALLIAMVCLYLKLLSFSNAHSFFVFSQWVRWCCVQTSEESVIIKLVLPSSCVYACV